MALIFVFVDFFFLFLGFFYCFCQRPHFFFVLPTQPTKKNQKMPRKIEDMKDARGGSRVDCGESEKVVFFYLWVFVVMLRGMQKRPISSPGDQVFTFLARQTRSASEQNLEI